MEIAISGSNGYIGKVLISKLKSARHSIILISREELYNPEKLRKTISGTDAVIHLAGAPILQRWTSASKDEILRSRVETTRNIVSVINNLPAEERPKTFICASAIGIYKSGQHHTEQSQSFSDDFTAEVVKQWENASTDLNNYIRRVIFRIGIVIGRESATMKQLLPVFKLGFGGKIGSGKQAFPFVHIDDVVNAFFWACQNNEVSGIFNLSAPQNIDNNQFTKKLAERLNRKAFLYVPESILKIMYGEAATMLTNSPQAYPDRLLHYGYRFKYPDIDSSLREIIG